MERNLNFNYCTQYQFLSKTEETKKKEAKQEEDVNGKEMRMKGGRRWKRKVVKLNSTFLCSKLYTVKMFCMCYPHSLNTIFLESSEFFAVILFTF